jgi:hypothetical protein
VLVVEWSTTQIAIVAVLVHHDVAIAIALREQRRK